MKAITLGADANGEPLLLSPEMRQSTHMHVIGGSGTGKSKFLEWMIRRDVREGNGLCLIDWHGTLYRDVLRYCAHLDIGLYSDFRRLILINPSQPDYITGFNPFMNRGVDVSVQVRRRIDATIRPWGITDTNQMPTFESVMFALYTFAVEQGETLPNAARLLEYERQELREYAAAVVEEYEGKRQLRRLLETKTLRDWRDFVMSTENRLGRFLGSTSVRRFMGMKEGNVDLLEAMDRGHIVLVNLGTSGYLDREAARVFASLFLNEFFETAMLRANQAPYGTKPKTFSLYLDEFQEYITDDIGSMLDQVRKGGLHMILAHQHFGHLLDNKRLLKSILANARLRAVFGGLDYEDACLIANEMFLPDLNTRQIKKAYYHTIHLYEEQMRLIRSRSRGTGYTEGESWSGGEGSSSTEGQSYSTSRGTGSSSGHGASRGEGQSGGMSFGAPGTTGALAGPATQMPTEGWFTQSEGQSNFAAQSQSESDSDFVSESEARSSATSESTFYSEGGSTARSYSEATGEAEVPVWVPIPVQELTTETEWSREEKVSRVAEILKTQQQRHCFIKLDTTRTQPLLVPVVREYLTSSQSLLEYEQTVYSEQGALPGAAVDRILQQSEESFLTLTRQAPIDVTPLTEEPPALPAAPNSKAKQPKKIKKSIFETINDDPIGRE
jgi:hypothetical protein